MTHVFGVRPEDGRTVWVSFATLFAIVGSYIVLETARDALFLADLPARTLPWAYLGIAVLTLVVSSGGGRLFAGRAPRRVLALTVLCGAVGTAAFWPIVATPSRASLLSLYVWTGLLASLVVPQFWVMVATRVDIGQAKRAYAVIAAGGMLGATVGSLVAGVIVTIASSRALLPFAAACFGLTACIPAFAGDAPEPQAPARPAEDEERPGLRAVWADPYLKRLLVLAMVSPVIVMAIDFVFKSIVSHQVPRASLGRFFASYNALVNATALTVQLTLAPRLIQRLGVVRILCLLPSVLGAAALSLAATAAFPAALILRGIDGTLRHSVHRAATEILFLPLPAATRGTLRALAEAIGQRGGQLVGSALILVAIRMGASARGIAAGVAVLCVGWLLGYVRLQRHYVERFRTQLRALAATTDASIPELDQQSVEALMASLASSNDAEVLAALDLLEAYGRIRLVSPLILYHPSPPVVLRALELFDGIERDDLRELRRRLLEHADESVRAASLRRVAAGGHDRSVVRACLRRDPSQLVRRTALVLWMGFEDAPASDLDDAVADLMALQDPKSRLAVATALGELPVRALLPVARVLLDDATPQVRRQVARSLATDPDPERLALLTEMVAIPECRAFARAGLCALGSSALEHLAGALGSSDTPPAIRRHLPRTISCFASSRAGEILVTQLGREEDGRVIYKILRGLGRMRADDPTLPIDRGIVMAVGERTLQRLIELLAYRVAYESVGQVEAPADTALDDSDLLGRLLAEMEERALERMFRVLQILETSEEFATIHQALEAGGPGLRASGRELIGHVLEGAFRDVLLALTDSLPAAERLEAATKAFPVPIAETALDARSARTPAGSTAHSAAALEEALRALCNDRSLTLSSLARHELAARATVRVGDSRAAG